MNDQFTLLIMERFSILRKEEVDGSTIVSIR
jgi:hypothetical protein